MVVGAEAAEQLARELDADIVLNAMVGAVGLPPTLAALQSGKTLALANKESLIVGGELVMDLVKGEPERLVPVDSEHAALAQCLRGESREDLRRVVITASGGPFRGWTREELAKASVKEALAHPTWKMGPKITIDSATLMNKGLEVIEAHFLFGLDYSQIDVVVHPESVIHGIAEFGDGAMVAQLSKPDMRLPIQLALAYPERLPAGIEPLDLATLGSLTFEPVDREAFTALDLCFKAGRLGSTFPAVLNAANEVAVMAFLEAKIAMTGIPDVVERVLDDHEPASVVSVVTLDRADAWARRRAAEIIDSG
jgi:1-deoxy-D-xylulose-5-phosphate reductoisomerase